MRSTPRKLEDSNRLWTTCSTSTLLQKPGECDIIIQVQIWRIAPPRCCPCSMAGRCQRWSVESVEVRAFKSFGSSWTHYDFGSRHSVAIVGQNGCGKSNLLEALAFASGCSASVLRARELKDITSTENKSQVRLHPHVDNASASSAKAIACAVSGSVFIGSTCLCRINV